MIILVLPWVIHPTGLCQKLNPFVYSPHLIQTLTFYLQLALSPLLQFHFYLTSYKEILQNVYVFLQTWDLYVGIGVELNFKWIFDWDPSSTVWQKHYHQWWSMEHLHYFKSLIFRVFIPFRDLKTMKVHLVSISCVVSTPLPPCRWLWIHTTAAMPMTM